MVVTDAVGGARIQEADSPESLREVLTQHEADLLITDYSMPGVAPDSIEMLEGLRRDFPGLKIIVLTMNSNAGIHDLVRRLGVWGVVLKSSPWQELSDAVQAVIRGEEHIATRRPSRRKSARIGTSELSMREAEVLRQVASGRSVSEIAQRTGHSVKTVSCQKQDAMAKLGLVNDAEIFAFAHARRWVT